MRRVPVQSSVIKSVGYDGLSLEIVFANGSTKIYDGVPPDVHTAMMRADSIGRFFNTQVRNRYTCISSQSAPGAGPADGTPAPASAPGPKPGQGLVSSRPVRGIRVRRG